MCRKISRNISCALVPSHYQFLCALKSNFYEYNNYRINYALCKKVKAVKVKKKNVEWD